MSRVSVCEYVCVKKIFGNPQGWNLINMHVLHVVNESTIDRRASSALGTS